MSKTKIKKPSAAGRLKEFEKEHQRGIDTLKALDAQRNNVVQQVLRIEGAMQVLKDIIDPPDTKEGSPDGVKSEQ